MSEKLTREQVEELLPDELEEKQWGEVMVPCDKLRALCDLALSALSREAGTEGWKMVPIKPTKEMVLAAYYEIAGKGGPKSVYKAMLAASPAMPRGEGKGEE